MSGAQGSGRHRARISIESRNGIARSGSLGFKLQIMMPILPLLCNYFWNTSCHSLWFRYFDYQDLNPRHSEGHITQSPDCLTFTDEISEQLTPAIAGVFSSCLGSAITFMIQDRLNEITMGTIDDAVSETQSFPSQRTTSRVQCWPLVAAETVIPPYFMIPCQIVPRRKVE